MGVGRWHNIRTRIRAHTHAHTHLHTYTNTHINKTEMEKGSGVRKGANGRLGKGVGWGGALRIQEQKIA